MGRAAETDHLAKLGAAEAKPRGSIQIASGSQAAEGLVAVLSCGKRLCVHSMDTLCKTLGVAQARAPYGKPLAHSEIRALILVAFFRRLLCIRQRLGLRIGPGHDDGGER